MPHLICFYSKTKNRLLMTAVIFILIFLLLFHSIYYWHDIVFTSSNPFSSPIFHVETEKKMIALTFDTEWNEATEKRLFSILEQYQAKATFFVTGKWAKNHPEELRAIAAAGHEIGNHSNQHPHMTKLNPVLIKAEILECNNTIHSITGTKPALFRPPYGEYNDLVLNTAAQFSLTSILWTIDSEDWKNLSPAAIAQTVLSQCNAGSILLFHSNALNTPEALIIILQTLQNQGYQFCTVSELLALS